MNRGIDESTPAIVCHVEPRSKRKSTPSSQHADRDGTTNGPSLNWTNGQCSATQGQRKRAAEIRRCKTKRNSGILVYCSSLVQRLGECLLLSVYESIHKPGYSTEFPLCRSVYVAWTALHTAYGVAGQKTHRSLRKKGKRKLRSQVHDRAKNHTPPAKAN